MAPVRHHSGVLGKVGGTPLLKLERIGASLEANLFVKCEFVNPSGSIKDRVALKMVEGAERRGKLKKGSTIIEVTSGNMGPALSFIGGVRKYGVRILIPSKWTGTYNPENRIKLMKLFGANVTSYGLDEYSSLLDRLPSAQFSAAVFALGMKACYDLERDNRSYWWSDQMSNPDNTLAHREGTGKEIFEQMHGKIDAFVASVGSGGTLLGVYEALSKRGVGAEIIGVEPRDSKVLEEWARKGFLSSFLEKSGMPRRRYIIEEMVRRGVPDEIVSVGDEDARLMANRLAREEDLFCGMSSGANVFVALKVAKRLGAGSNVVTVCVDRRDRYLPEYPNEKYVI